MKGERGIDRHATGLHNHACPVSVTVLTKNEESLIRRCLSSVLWAGEIVVLDSGSTDRTREIAREMGAKVYDQPWLGWVEQRRRSIELCTFDWIFVIDADEIVTGKLANAIMDAMKGSPSPDTGFVVDRRDELFGRLLPNMKRRSLRDSFVRLFNRRRSNYDPHDLIHETVTCPGPHVKLDGQLLHWRGVSFIEQVQKDPAVAELEAKTLLASGQTIGAASLLYRPVLRFLWCYVWRGAWRSGSAGLMYAAMRAHAEFLRYGIAFEAQNARADLDPPKSVFDPAAMPSRADAVHTHARSA